MPQPDSLHWLIESRHFLAEHFADSVDLRSAAEVAAYSPYHYHRKFTAAFGETPLEFVTRLRFEEAKRLICRSDLSITEICMEVGYWSPSTFSLAFADRFGMSPAQFRRVFVVPGVWAWKLIPSCFYIPGTKGKIR